MRSQTTKAFRGRFENLPAAVQAQARQAYRLFQADPSHLGLRFKQVVLPPPTYFVRVGISYRAVGVLDGDTITWFWIGSHANYDRLLAQL